jgi:carbohydrate-selective porin OprB
MNKNLKIALLTHLAVAVLPAVANAQSATERIDNGFVSILDVAPQAYCGFKRMPKFYGDANMNRETIDGSLLERQYLLGSLGGLRDRAAAAGLVFDGGVTQVVQGAVSGDADGTRYAGSADLWGVLDTGRAQLWSGGLIVAHLEGNWGKTVTGTGGLIPLNGDAIMPGAPASLALSELFLFQALPANFSVIAGKLDWAGIADTSLFANNERSQFLNESLINNAILGAFVPYTAIGGALAYQLTEELGLTAVAFSNDSTALEPSFDTFGANAMSYALTGAWTPKFGNLPGNYNFILGYTSKDAVNFDVDNAYLIGEITGTVPVAKRNGNYAFTLAGSQYLHVNDSAKRADGQPVGIGVFGRFGIAPAGRNVVDQFYSLGLGGTGGLFDRVDDSWGIGWAGTHLSSDLRDDLALLGEQVDEFEHAFEAYYNVALTPAVHTSVHAQYVAPAVQGADDSVVLSMRMQLDF